MAAAAASTHFTLASTLLGLKADAKPVITTERPSSTSPFDMMRVDALLLVTRNKVPGTKEPDTNDLVLCNNVELLYEGCKVIIIIDTTSTYYDNRTTGEYSKSSYAVPFMCTDISPPNITLTTTTKLYKYISNDYELICNENSQFIENLRTLQYFASQGRLYYKKMDPGSMGGFNTEPPFKKSKRNPKNVNSLPRNGGYRKTHRAKKSKRNTKRHRK